MSDNLKEREMFEAWAQQILGDNPTWRESGPCELAWLAWCSAIEADRVSRDVPAVPPFGSRRNAALALYQPPFRFVHGYIYDANGKMCADDDAVPEHIAARVRGWGRIGYLPDAAALQDEVGQMIAEALTAFWLAESPQPQPVQPSQFGSPELQSLILEKLAQPVQAQPSKAEQERDAIAELNHAQWLALENVRVLAARNRSEEWAQHMLRFVADAGTNKAQIMREQVAEQAQKEE